MSTESRRARRGLMQQQMNEVVETARQKLSLIDVQSIRIERAEGPVMQTGRPVTVATFEEAATILRAWSESAPKTGGYDKCDFKVTWTDGEHYEGRYDLKHWSCEDEPLSIAQHVRDHITFQAGIGRPDHMSEETYRIVLQRYDTYHPGLRAACLRFLGKYRIADAVTTQREA